MNSGSQNSLEHLAQVATILPYQSSGMELHDPRQRHHRRVASDDMTRGYAGGRYPRYPVPMGQRSPGGSTVIFPRDSSAWSRMVATHPYHPGTRPFESGDMQQPNVDQMIGQTPCRLT